MMQFNQKNIGIILLSISVILIALLGFAKFNFDKHNISDEEFLHFVMNFSEKTIISEINGDINGFAFYLNLEDESLRKIIKNEIDFLDYKIFLELFLENGENIHFVFTAATHWLIILKELKNIIKQKFPRSVSWFSPDMKKLNLILIRRENASSNYSFNAFYRNNSCGC